MMSAAEIRNFTWLNGEARQAVLHACYAVSQWRHEITLANDRYLSRVLDQVAAAQRAQGWPDSAALATREHLLRASKVQTQMLDQLMGDWEGQLKSRTASPDPSRLRTTSTADPMSEMIGEITLTPFKIWLRAAEAWQHSWADAMRSSRDTYSAPVQRAA